MVANSLDIRSETVILRPAQVKDRRAIYEWLALSDIASFMNGQPNFPDKPVPTWEEFQVGYVESYFDDSTPLSGRCFLILVEGAPAGQINYNEIKQFAGRKRTELDIWMRSSQFCGKGYGVDALVMLCGFLSDRFGVQDFMVQPSARNPLAIRAYEKAGFSKLDINDVQKWESWGSRDYDDSIIMIKRL